MLATCLLIADAKGKKHKKNGEAKKAKARAGAGRINGRDSKVTFRPFISLIFNFLYLLHFISFIFYILYLISFIFRSGNDLDSRYYYTCIILYECATLKFRKPRAKYFFNARQ